MVAGYDIYHSGLLLCAIYLAWALRPVAACLSLKLSVSRPSSGPCIAYFVENNTCELIVDLFARHGAGRRHAPRSFPHSFHLI